MSDIQKQKIQEILRVIEEINNILDTEPFNKKEYKNKNKELKELTDIYIKTYEKQKLYNHPVIKKKWDEIKKKGKTKNKKRKTKKKSNLNEAGAANTQSVETMLNLNALNSAPASKGKAPASKGKAPASKGKAPASNSKAPASNGKQPTENNNLGEQVMLSEKRKGKQRAEIQNVNEMNQHGYIIPNSNTTVKMAEAANVSEIVKEIQPVKATEEIKMTKRKGKEPAKLTQKKNNSKVNQPSHMFTTRGNDNGAGPANNNPFIKSVKKDGYRLLERKLTRKKERAIKKMNLSELNKKLVNLLGDCSFSVKDEKKNEEFQRDMEILLREDQLELFIEDSIRLLNIAKASGKKKIAIIDGENIMHYTAFKARLTFNLLKTLINKDYFVFIFRHQGNNLNLFPKNSEEENLLNNYTYQIQIGKSGSFLDDFCSVLLGSLSCALGNYYGNPTFLTDTGKFKTSGLFSKTLSKTSFNKGIDVSIGSLNTKNANKLTMIRDIRNAKEEILPDNFILTLDKFKWCKFKKKKEKKKRNSNEAGPAEEP